MLLADIGDALGLDSFFVEIKLNGRTRAFFKTENPALVHGFGDGPHFFDGNRFVFVEYLADFVLRKTSLGHGFLGAFKGGTA